MNPIASAIAGDPSQPHDFAVRNTSPVDSGQHPSRSCSNTACVPFPIPGAPSSTNLHALPGNGPVPEHGNFGPFSQAARSPVVIMEGSLKTDETHPQCPK